MANQKRNQMSNQMSNERSKSVKSTSEINHKVKKNWSEETIEDAENDGDQDYEETEDDDEDADFDSDDYDDSDYDDSDDDDSDDDDSDDDDSDDDDSDDDDSDYDDSEDDYSEDDDSDKKSGEEQPLLISSLMSSPEVPVGKYNAVIVDISTERQTGKYGPFYFFDVYLELETKKGMLPVKDRMTINLKEGAKLNRLLLALLGKVPKSDYDLRKIVGKEVGVRITHRKDDEGRLWPEVMYLR